MRDSAPVSLLICKGKKSFLKIFDDAPIATRADLDRAQFRVNLQVLPENRGSMSC